MSNGGDEREETAGGQEPAPDAEDGSGEPLTSGPGRTESGPGSEECEEVTASRSDQPAASAGGEQASDRRDQRGPNGRAAAGEGRVAAGIDRPTEITSPEEYMTDRRSLSPRVQLLWAIRRSIGAVVLGLISVFVLSALDQELWLAGVIVAALAVLGALWAVLHYRVWVYQIQNDAIYLERGVLTHVRTLVPYVRIQHVDTSRSPFERALGLSTLVVYTAGSRGADISVPGLTPEEARDLQQRVKELAIEAEGDDAL